MRAAWYEEFGPAADVLAVGDMADPTPGPGEVLVRVRASGINPSDVKLRAGARPGATMAFPRIIPHSDGAGEIEAVGVGVDPARRGERVWLWNAGWQRAFGTAAEYVALPSEQAVRLPDGTKYAEGACFGIPAMTAWYALFSDGPVEGQTILVTGGAGTVGRYACQMAKLGGARVITTVSSVQKAAHSTAEAWVDYRKDSVVDAVMDFTDGTGVDRIVDVDFGANQADTIALIKPGGVVATYASASQMAPALQFYPLMFKNVTLRMLIVYLLNPALRARGHGQLSEWLEAGALGHAVVAGGTLDEVAKAHALVEGGGKLGTVVIDV